MNDIILKVPYYSQRDSKVFGQASRSCFSSSCAMLVKHLKPGALTDSPNADDDYLRRVLQFGDTTNHDAQLQAMRFLGLDVNIFYTLGWPHIDRQLERGFPVPIGILHKYPMPGPFGGGHWIVVVGRVGDAMLVHDPYGELDLVNGGYPDPAAPGAFLRYSRRFLGPRWLGRGNGKSGWGVIARKG